jgi:gamma-glutamyltranspeptidase
MGPPSSGGIAVTQALGILENFSLAQLAPTNLDLEGGKPTVMGVHLVSEAERLAYADRNKYVADADYVPLPGMGVSTMLDKTYLRQRASLVSLVSSIGTALPGDLGPIPMGSDTGPLESGTSQVTVVDRAGNAVSMTTTVESTLGSYHMTNGFILNNQLTDFSSTPADAAGDPIANRLAPGKRPRSSMAPTLVFKVAADGGIGDFVMATGSPGGSTIIQYVIKTLVGALDWGLDAQQATNLVDFGSADGATTNVGGEHPNIDARLQEARRALQPASGPLRDREDRRGLRGRGVHRRDRLLAGGHRERRRHVRNGARRGSLPAALAVRPARDHGVRLRRGRRAGRRARGRVPGALPLGADGGDDPAPRPRPGGLRGRARG